MPLELSLTLIAVFLSVALISGSLTLSCWHITRLAAGGCEILGDVKASSCSKGGTRSFPR